MRLLGDEAEACPLVDMARGMEDVVGPERHAPVARVTGEAEALLHQPASQTEPARLGLHQQQTELRHFVALADHHYRAQDLPLALGDPAALAPGIEFLEEFGGDLRHQRLEALVPAIFLGIEGAMAVDDPAQIPRPMWPENIGRSGRGP